MGEGGREGVREGGKHRGEDSETTPCPTEREETHSAGSL